VKVSIKLDVHQPSKQKNYSPENHFTFSKP